MRGRSRQSAQRWVLLPLLIAVSFSFGAFGPHADPDRADPAGRAYPQHLPPKLFIQLQLYYPAESLLTQAADWDVLVLDAETVKSRRGFLGPGGRIRSRNAKAVGLNIEPDYPTYGAWRDAQLQGTFELSIQNEAQMSSTVWNYYNWVFQNPATREHISATQFGNYGLYDNAEAFDLLNQLDMVKLGDDAAISAITSKLQKITLTELPSIPLWYNGLWAQYSNAVWTNWPSSADGSNHFLPASWRGYWNLSGIQMLLNLQPVPPAE